MKVSAFTLVETLIALALASGLLILVFGMLPYVSSFSNNFFSSLIDDQELEEYYRLQHYLNHYEFVEESEGFIVLANRNESCQVDLVGNRIMKNGYVDSLKSVEIQSFECRVDSLVLRFKLSSDTTKVLRLKRASMMGEASRIMQMKASIK